MRVMIPMLATTYGESVTLKENKMLINPIYVSESNSLLYIVEYITTGPFFNACFIV